VTGALGPTRSGARKGSAVVIHGAMLGGERAKVGGQVLVPERFAHAQHFVGENSALHLSPQ
jgi:hypothetical protein